MVTKSYWYKLFSRKTNFNPPQISHPLEWDSFSKCCHNVRKIYMGKNKIDKANEKYFFGFRTVLLHDSIWNSIFHCRYFCIWSQWNWFLSPHVVIIYLSQKTLKKKTLKRQNYVSEFSIPYHQILPTPPPHPSQKKKSKQKNKL